MSRIALIGAGASNLFLATLLSSKHQVEIIEVRDRVGKKILETGNGRCNFLNDNISAKYYNDEKFLTTLIKDIDKDKILEHFKSLGLSYYLDEEGRYYPYSNSASSILDILRLNYLNKGFKERVNAKISSIKYLNDYELIIDGKKEHFDYLFIATGSKVNNPFYSPLPLDLKIIKPSPSLAPLKINISGVKGVRCKCKVSLKDNDKLIYEETGEVIFRDNGISGVVILNISFMINKYRLTNPKIYLDFLPNLTEDELISILTKRDKSTFYIGLINKSLASLISKSLTNYDVNKLAKLLKNYHFEVLGIIDAPQVCNGGVSIEEIDENFQAKRYPNMYLLGEMLNIDGMCGGYNLYFAFASSYKAYLDFLRRSNNV